MCKHRINALDHDGLVLEDVVPGQKIQVRVPISGCNRFKVVTSDYRDEDDDNTMIITVEDASGKERTYTTSQLGLTSDRYGEWTNVAVLV